MLTVWGLAAGSPYMRALCSSTMREADGPLVLRDVQPSHFSAVLSFLYHGNVQVTPSSLAGVMAAASLLEVTAILELCDENAVASWRAALSLQRPELQPRLCAPPL